MPTRPKRVSAVSYTEPSPSPEPEVEESDPERDGSGEDELESEDDELDDEEEVDELEDRDQDAEGEEEDVEDQMDIDIDAEGEDEEEEVTVPPPQPVKIRFTVNQTPGSSSSLTPATGSGSSHGKLKKGAVGGGGGQRAKHARIASPLKRSSQDPYSDDNLDLDNDEEGTRSISPSKLTARQRAKGNKDLQETLVSLPEIGKSKALVLTEAERLQRREESARRRKRQTEQRQQDEQDQTINRLLRAQTSKSRSKLDAPTDKDASPAPGASASEAVGGAGSGELGGEGGEVEGTIRGKRKREMGVNEGMIRFVSKLNEEGGLVQLVGVVEGKEGWIAV